MCNVIGIACKGIAVTTAGDYVCQGCFAQGHCQSLRAL